MRTLTGEDFVTYGRVTKAGVMMLEPTTITSYGSAIILAPYGVFGKDLHVFIRDRDVLHTGDALPSVAELYEITIKNAYEACRETFREAVEASKSIILEKAKKDSAPRDQAGPPTNDDEVRETLGIPKEFSGSSSRSKTIDNLVKLAERAGKGRGAGPKDGD